MNGGIHAYGGLLGVRHNTSFIFEKGALTSTPSCATRSARSIILGQLRNTLEPRLAMYFSSASSELRALLTPAVRQQLRADYLLITGGGAAAAALCVKMGMPSCKELRDR